MAGLHGTHDGAADGGVDLVALGDDAHAITQCAGGEDRVIDLSHGDNLAGRRRSDVGGGTSGRLSRLGGGVFLGGRCGGSTGASAGSGGCGGVGKRGVVGGVGVVELGLFGCLAGGLSLSALLRGAVVSDEDRQEGHDECHSNGDGVLGHRAKHGDGQQGGEDEGIRGDAVGAQGQKCHGQATGKAAHQHARVDALVTQVNAVERRLGDAAQQARNQCGAGGLTHHGVFVADGQCQHGGGGAEAGEVPSTHWALDEVIAQGLDVYQHQGVQWPVQTQRNQERVDHRDSQGEDEWNVVIHPGQAGADAVTGPYAERADEKCRERDDDEHGEERDEHHVQSRRNDLLEEAVDQRCHKSHHQRHEDIAAVPRKLHGHAEDRNGALLAAQRIVDHALDGRVLRKAQELRSQQGGHDGARDPWVDAQLLAGVVGHHQRQEVEDGAPHGVDEEPRGGLVLGAEVDDSECVEDRREGLSSPAKR